MKKRIVCLVLAALMAVTLLCACGNKNKVISQAEAEKIALEHFDLSASEVDGIHTHISSGEIVGYSIHITVGDTEYSILVEATTGDVYASDH